MKNVLVISTSLRVGSNSDVLAREFAKGARDAGNQVEYVSLHGKSIHFCTGCLACQETQKCAVQDDANDIVEKMLRADVICFATPVYYYEMSGQMKTLLDRSNSLYTTDYAFRDVYLLTASAEVEDSAADGPINGLNGWIACYPKCRFAGAVRGGGADGPGAMEQKPEKLKQAYEMGKSV